MQYFTPLLLASALVGAAAQGPYTCDELKVASDATDTPFCSQEDHWESCNFVCTDEQDCTGLTCCLCVNGEFNRWACGLASSVCGDPHFHLWGGEKVSYHGTCDLVAVKSSKFGAGAGLNVHVRTEPRSDWSMISNAAIKIGDDVLEVVRDGTYYINGALNPDLPSSLAGYGVTKEVKCKKERCSDVFIVGEGIVSVKVFKGFLWVDMRAFEEELSDAAGIQGKYGEVGMFARDGKTILSDINEYGNEWQVRDEPQLFQTVRAPQYPEPCLPPGEKDQRRRLGNVESMAEMACAQVDDHMRESCIFDVMGTGDVEMADAYMD